MAQAFRTIEAPASVRAAVSNEGRPDEERRALRVVDGASRTASAVALKHAINADGVGTRGIEHPSSADRAVAAERDGNEHRTTIIVPKTPPPLPTLFPSNATFCSWGADPLMLYIPPPAPATLA